MENFKTREELVQIVTDINVAVGFGGMHLELASDENAEVMVDFLIKEYFPNETVTTSIGHVVDENFKSMLVRRFIASNLSLLLIDDVTNDIIGVNTIVIQHKDGPLSRSKIENDKIRSIHIFFEHKNAEMDVFRYYDIDAVLHFLHLGVRKDYRRRGLASKLTEAALMYCKQIGLKKPCVLTEATSNYSQKIFDKFGFETLHRMEFEDYKVDGEVVFKNTGETKAAVIYVKKL